MSSLFQPILRLLFSLVLISIWMVVDVATAFSLLFAVAVVLVSIDEWSSYKQKRKPQEN